MSPEPFKYMEYVDVSVEEGWKLKKDAPDYVVKAFEEWQKDASSDLIIEE
jgi:3-methyladenine DNA glycosylase AlkC